MGLIWETMTHHLALEKSQSYRISVKKEPNAMSLAWRNNSIFIGLI
jgi:hypothetical protein